MHTTRSRRFVRRAVMALSAVVLLLGGYVTAWLTFSRAVQAGVVPYDVPIITQGIPMLFQPIIAYANSDNPGAMTLRKMWWSLNKEKGLGGDTHLAIGDVWFAPDRPDK